MRSNYITQSITFDPRQWAHLHDGAWLQEMSGLGHTLGTNSSRTETLSLNGKNRVVLDCLDVTVISML